MVLKNKANCLLTPLKRSDYRHYLNNRTAVSQALDKAQRRREAYDKHWALTFFELQDNQVYRKAEQRKDGTWIKARYAACIYDAMELIQKVHCNLHHAGEYITNFYQFLLNLLFFRRSQDIRPHPRTILWHYRRPSKVGDSTLRYLRTSSCQ